MNPRTFAFLSATAILVAIGVVAFLAKRRGRAIFSSGSELPDWNLNQLLLASFLTLFAELAFIRWIAVEVRVFAYFKNLALLLCFVGFGLGCALATRRVRWRLGITSFIGLLLVIRLPFGGKWLEGLSQNLGAAGDAE